jgi:hypothetical protein
MQDRDACQMRSSQESSVRVFLSYFELCVGSKWRTRCLATGDFVVCNGRMDFENLNKIFKDGFGMQNACLARGLHPVYGFGPSRGRWRECGRLQGLTTHPPIPSFPAGAWILKIYPRSLWADLVCKMRASLGACTQYMVLGPTKVAGASASDRETCANHQHADCQWLNAFTFAFMYAPQKKYARRHRVLCRSGVCHAC